MNSELGFNKRDSKRHSTFSLYNKDQTDGIKQKFSNKQDQKIPQTSSQTDSTFGNRSKMNKKDIQPMPNPETVFRNTGKPKNEMTTEVYMSMLGSGDTGSQANPF